MIRMTDSVVIGQLSKGTITGLESTRHPRILHIGGWRRTTRSTAAVGPTKRPLIRPDVPSERPGNTRGEDADGSPEGLPSASVQGWVSDRQVVEAHDRGELRRIETGTPDEGAVDVRLRHDLGHVPRLDRAAVLDAHGVGSR